MPARPLSGTRPAAPPGAAPGAAPAPLDAPGHASVSGLAGALAAPRRAVVLVGPPGPALTALLDRVLAELPGPAIRIRNPLSSPLTLHRLLIQLGADLDEGAGADPLLRVLGAQVVGGAPAVLAVDDAHTLASDALTALARVPCPASADQPGRLLILAGGPGLLALLQQPGLEGLRDAAVQVDAALAPAGQPPAPSPGRVPRVLGTRRGRAVLAGCGIAALAALALLARPARAPPRAVPLAGPVRPAASEAAAPAPPPPAAAAPADPAGPEPGAAPAPSQAAPEADGLRSPPLLPPAPSDDQLRREFEAFLDRAGQDTAQLSPAARASLFREYVEWRARNGAGARPAVPFPYGRGPG